MLRRLSSLTRPTLVGLLVLTFVAGCGSGDTERTATSESPAGTVAVTREADGVLRIGLLIPLSDSEAPFARDLAPIMEAVVGIMNNFGGFRGTDVEVVIRDEGSTPESAAKAARALVETDDVDAVIGPFSALSAPSAVPMLVASGIGVCSPSVSTSAMDYLSDNDLFIRTATLDTEIIRGMVDLAVQSGRERVSVAYPDDPYGRTLLRELKPALEARELNISTQVGYSPTDDSFQSEVTRLTSDSASVELLIGDPIDGPRFLNALIPAADGSVIITNDGMTTTTVAFDPDSAPESRPRIFGVAADTRQGNDVLLNIFSFSTSDYLIALSDLPSFTMNTVDCLTLIWLAALTAETDDAQIFKDEFSKVAKDGSTCNWLFDCSYIFDQGLNLDYEGVSSMTLDDLGNAVDRGTIIFGFDSDGRVKAVDGEPNFGFSEPDFFTP